MAAWLASLVADEWPLPDWLRRNLSQHPAVARQLEQIAALQVKLQQAANQELPPAQTSVCSWSQADQESAHDARSRERDVSRKPVVPIGLLLGTAAIVLACASLWVAQSQPGPAEPPVMSTASQPGDRRSMDLRPVLASLSAGQTVAQNVSAGMLRLSGRLAHAGEQVGSQCWMIFERMPPAAEAEPAEVPSDVSGDVREKAS